MSCACISNTENRHLLSNVKKLCNLGLLHDAIQVLDELVVERRVVSAIPISTFYCLLKACKSSRNLRAGRHVNWAMVRNGLENDAFLGCHLIHMFGACGSLSEADRTFRRLPTGDAFTWTAAISAHLACNHPSVALVLYSQMQRAAIAPNAYTFNAVLQACSDLSNSPSARSNGHMVCSHIVEQGLNSDAFLCNTLIDMYVKCGSVLDARDIFDALPNPSVVAWSSMITGYAQVGDGEETLRLFRLMLDKGPNPNVVTVLGLLKACQNTRCSDYGRCVHFLVVAASGLASEPAIGNSLIDMYTRCGSLEDAKRVFYGVPNKSLVTWSAIFSSFACYGCGHAALDLFLQMQCEGIMPDSPTFAGVLQSCRGAEMLHWAKLIHITILHTKQALEDLLGSIIVDTYFRCSSPMDATTVFGSLPRESVAPWNTLLGGFSETGQVETALDLFQRMQSEANIRPDTITYASVAKACVSAERLSYGDLVYTHVTSNGCEADEVIGNALVSMYAKHGSLENARALFDRLANRDVVSWSAMIAGYVEHGYGQQALHLFGNMLAEPDTVAFLLSLKACSMLSALDQGILVHAQLVECGYESDVSIGNSLIDMYAKCGSLDDAYSMFEKAPMRTVTTWNAMIGGCSRHSNYELVLEVFEDMRREGVRPNDATFVSLISVCNHLGLVSEGCSHFASIWAFDDDSMPYLDHYGCVIELLGKAGCLEEAVCVALTCPFETNAIILTSLLSRCKSYGDLTLGRECFDSMTRLGNYCSLGYGIASNFRGISK